MAYENLKLTLPNFVRSDGYFYTVDTATDILYKKVDNGENAFSYPLDTDIVNPVKAIHYDGVFFYTLECLPDSNGTIWVKRWRIEDYLLKQQKIYQFQGSSGMKLSCSAFAIEHFRRNLAGALAVGNSVISLKKFGSAGNPIGGNNRIQVGDHLFLGPSTSYANLGAVEEVVVAELIGEDSIRIATAGISKSFSINDPVVAPRRCWLFNQYQPYDNVGNGMLYSFDLGLTTPSLRAEAARADFKDVLAATFIVDEDYPGDTVYPAAPRGFVSYMKQTNLLFLEVQPEHPDYLSASESATQNNQRVDGSVIPVYGITSEKKTLFRLQKQAKIRTSDTTETDIEWSPYYNYQVATIKRIPTSISLTADPSIVPASISGTANITAIVKDQFDQPLGGQRVYFVDDDETGGQVQPQGDTVQNGADKGTVTVTYSGGTQSRLVKITASTT